MRFETFAYSGRGRGRPAGTDPLVSLRNPGGIGVNAAGVDEYFTEEDGAVMYFNEEEHEIGIGSVSDKEADDVANTISKTESGATIAPRAFLEDYELNPQVTTQFTPHWHDWNIRRARGVVSGR